MRFSRWRRSAMAVAGACGAAAAIAVPAMGGSNDRPRPMQLQTVEQSVPATRGSYCVRQPSASHEEGSGMCADSVFPPPVRGRLRLKPGQRFALRTHDLAIAKMRLNLLEVHHGDVDDVGHGFRAEPRRGHPARWIAKLPRDAGSMNRIDIFVRYEDGIGDASYTAGLKVR